MSSFRLRHERAFLIKIRHLEIGKLNKLFKIVEPNMFLLKGQKPLFTQLA